jgi:hypothetical protein
MDIAPATATVKPAASTAVELRNAAKNPLTAPSPAEAPDAHCDVPALRRPGHPHRAGVEARDVLESEELLPERDVPRLHEDQLVEYSAEPAGGDVPERPIKREIEDLVQDELPPEAVRRA